METNKGDSTIAQNHFNVVDGNVLNRLFDVQKQFVELPSKEEIAQLCAPSLLSIPGVSSCKVCLGDFFSLAGDFQDIHCNNCSNRTGNSIEFATISKHIECRNAYFPSLRTISLDTADYRFGNFVFNVDQPEMFDLYKPYLNSLGSFLAVTLESRLQKEILKSASDSLDFNDRTHSKNLKILNVSLEKEISIRRSTEQELLKRNRELIAIRNCNQELVRTVDEQKLINDICRIICEEAGYKMAWVGYVEHDEEKTVRPVAWSGQDDGYAANAHVSWDENNERGQGATGRAIRSGQTVFTKNLADNPIFKPWSGEAKKRGYNSSITLPMKNQSGEVFGALMIYSSENVDITHEEVSLLEDLASDLAFGIISLRLREKHKQAVDALKKSEEHYHSLFNRVNDGVYRSSIEGKLLDINPAMLKMFGYLNKQEMLDLDIKKDLYFNPEEHIKRVRNIDVKSVEYFHLRRKDGSELWVEDNSNVERDENGNTIFFEGVLRDVSERKRIEDELIRAKENAIVSDRLKTVFLQNISHEIRTPMNAICGFSKILSEADLSKEEWHQFSEIVQINVDQLLTIITDIITISSIELNQEEVHLQPTCINDMMDDLYAIFKERAVTHQNSISVEKTLSDDQSIILTDSNKVKNILQNLLTNALKFTNNGSVNFGYHLKNSEFEFYVKDTGPGIEPEMHQMIFDNFKKNMDDKKFNFGGTGLGLSIAKGFTNLLGGRIWLDSQINQGSTFYFTIPNKLIQ